MIRKFLFLMLLAAPVFSFNSCSGNRLSDFAEKGPKFEMERFFTGKSKAWGVYYDWNSKLQRRFTADIEGRMEGDILKFDELIRYDDGETLTRYWTVQKVAEGKYKSTAPDVVGEGEGESSGNAMRWRYVVNINTNDGPVPVKFDDWMFMLDEKRFFNRASMSKYGIQIGEVFLFAEKE